jgi:hypothetical protein
LFNQTEKAMQDFNRFPKAGDVSLTDQFFTDSAGVSHPIYSKVLSIVSFPNATTAATAHGIAAINLECGVNIRKVNARLITPPTVTLQDKSKFSFTVDATNLNITTLTDLHLYTGEVVIEYCPV